MKSRLRLSSVLLAALLAASASLQAAPNVQHNLTATADSTWTGSTWSNGTPDGTTAGDMATFGINFVTATPLTLNSDITVGSIFVTGSARAVTIASNSTNVITLDGTGANTTTNGFGHAGVASLRINTTGAGVAVINPNIVLATNTDIGTTSGDDEVVVNGNITATSAVTLNFQNDSTTTGVATSVTGSIAATGSAISISNNNATGAAASTVTLSGAIGGAGSVTQNSATATLNLNGANTYTGGTTLNQGTLTVGAAGTLGATTGALTVNNANTALAGNAVVLNLSTGANTMTGSLSGTLATPISGTNTATINILGSRTFSVNQTADGTYTGVLAGTGGGFTLGSLSTSTLTLSGTNTYTGATTVNSGTLLVNGSLTSIVTVNAGAFGGGGSSNASVNIGNASGSGDSFLRAGGNAAIGTFTTTGATTLNSDAVFAVDFNSSLASFDKLVTNGLTISGASLSLSDLGSAALAGNQTFTIIDNTGAGSIAGTFTGLSEGAVITIGSNNFTISYAGGTGNDIVLTTSAVPEPSTYAALAGLVTLGVATLRRRRA
jgi:fibronectin-binding autotransporter adhesin